MTTPINANKLTSADLLKFKRYLVENVSRSMEGETCNWATGARSSNNAWRRSTPRPA
jgi:hypothetical protein